MQNLDGIKKIHFIGIGGSGMFPMAQILKSKGFEITGSDIYESDTLEKVKKLGIEVKLGHKKENVTNQDLIVYSAAIKENNPERLAAKEKNIPQIERCEMLGILFNKYQKSIAVSGTHGKTTTTAMITHILVEAGESPTAIIGGTLSSLGGNSCCGNSEIVVCEACEYVDSFLNLFPFVSVVTNVDADHLDYFKNLEGVKKSFEKFLNQTKELVVANGDDENTLDTLKDVNIKKIFYGLKNEESDYLAKNFIFNENCFANFDVFYCGKKIENISLSIPGKHNIYNALAAFAVCHFFGVKPENIKSALKSFKGVHRRFEILGTKKGITVADDFAHHPTELTVTLETAVKMGFKRVWAVFQPHTFSRTSMFLDEFAKALSIVDFAVVSEILPVRETNTYGIKAQDLVEKIPNGRYFKTFEEISQYVSENAKEGDLILTLGGGNPYVCANMILEKI